MKHLTTLLLTLLVSGSLWAEDELPIEFVSLEKGCLADYQSKECELAQNLIYGSKLSELITTAYEPVSSLEGMKQHLWNILYGLNQNSNANEKQKYEIGFRFIMALYKKPFPCSKELILDEECPELQEATLRYRLTQYQEKKKLKKDKMAMEKAFQIWLTESDNLFNIREEERLVEISNQQAKFNKAKLESKKTKCREYGFKDDTDGMGLCLIELDKLAELEKQTQILRNKQNVVASNDSSRNDEYINELNRELKRQQRQRESQALINLGAAILGAGVPQSSAKRIKDVCTYNCGLETVTVDEFICPPTISYKGKICYKD